MTATSLLSAGAVLAGIIATIVLAGRFLPLARLTRQHAGAAGRLTLVGSLHLDPRRRLLLVQCEGRSVLLLTGQQDQVVGWLPDRAS